MSEKKEKTANEPAAEVNDASQEAPVEDHSEKTQKAPEDVKLNAIFAFKKGMSTVFGEKGEAIPVTVLKFEPHVVSQLKTKEKHGYSSVQVAFLPKRDSRTSSAERGHLKKAGFENGARFMREVRQDIPEGCEVGKKVSIESLTAGDKVKVSGTSKGRGFAGTMKRYNHGGGPASHGAGFHRRPGSIGNCTFPGRVMKGRKMPGNFGNDWVTVKNVKIVSVVPEENVVMIKGPVPGAVNSLVQLVKQ